MIKMTREEAIQKHRDMWNWIADKTIERGHVITEDDYFNDMGIPENERPTCYCYCCKYASQHKTNNEAMCRYCPIDWGNDCLAAPCIRDCINDKESLFSIWTKTADYKESATLARQIANLPERK